VHYIGAGACEIDATQVGLHGTDTTQQETFTIVKAELVIVGSSATITYGSPVPAVTPSYVGLVNGDSSPSIKPICSTLLAAATALGTYGTSCAGAASANYTIAYEPGSITVVKASSRTSLVVTPKTLTTRQQARLTVNVGLSSGAHALGQVKIYDGKRLLKTVTIAGNRVVLELGSLARGTHKLRAAYAGNANITGSTSASLTVKVSRRK